MIDYTGATRQELEILRDALRGYLKRQRENAQFTGQADAWGDPLDSPYLQTHKAFDAVLQAIEKLDDDLARYLALGVTSPQEEQLVRKYVQGG